MSENTSTSNDKGDAMTEQSKELFSVARASIVIGAEEAEGGGVHVHSESSTSTKGQEPSRHPDAKRERNMPYVPDGMTEDEWIDSPDWHPDTAGILAYYEVAWEERNGWDGEPLDPIHQARKQFHLWLNKELAKAKSDALAPVLAVLEENSWPKYNGQDEDWLIDIKDVRDAIEEAGA